MTFIILNIILIYIFQGMIIIFLLLPSQLFYALFKKGYTGFIYKLMALPYVLVNKLCRGGYELWSMYKIGKIPSCHLRRWLFYMTGVEMGGKSVVHINTKIRSPWKLSIGKGSIIGDNCTLDARMKIKIGKNVNLSSNVAIWTLQHNHRSPDFACFDEKERKMSVEIGDRVWLGCNVIVLPGVTIGEGAVCCGGSVVAKDVPPFKIVAGIPAHVIGNRNEKLTYEFNGVSNRIF